MPVENSKQLVPSLILLASMEISLKRAHETDFAFAQDLIKSDQCPEFNGYNTKLCREAGQYVNSKTTADYLPLIDMTPSDPDTIMTSMSKAKCLTAKYGQNFTVFTGDLQLYRVAVNILWAYPEQYDDFILRLGRMHLLMSFIGSVGSLMAESGLSEILDSTFGGVQKMLTGKKFPQNMRALRLVVEELLRHLFERIELDSYRDMVKVLDDIGRRSRTSRVWIECLIKAVFIMMVYVRAEREADWPLHLKAVKLMLPYFFAASHVNYARYGTYYLISMMRFPPAKRFMKGEHVMRHIPRIWNGIWSDMFIESTFMRYGHGKKGIIGVTLKPETLKIWGLSLHICSRIEEDITNITSLEKVDGQKRHKEELKGRITTDARDRESIRKKLELCIDPLDPCKHPEAIINVASGQLAAESVNVDLAIELGSEAMNKFQSSLPQGFDKKISKTVVTRSEGKKHVKVGETKVFDTSLIFSRVIGLQASSRDSIDIKTLLSYELEPVPTSIFSNSGDLRISKAKSEWKRQLQSFVSVRLTEKDITCCILDGSEILYVVNWPDKGVLKDYKINFKDYVSKLLKRANVYLVFDRYKPYSTKSVIRSGRITQASRIHQLNLTMQLPARNAVLTVTKNKQQLIKMICDELIQDASFHNSNTSVHKLVVTGENESPIEIHKSVTIKRVDLKTTHEEADNILAHHMVAAAQENQKGVSVVSDDTDVFVLLLHHYKAQNLSLPVVMESPIKERAVIDIRQTVLQNSDIVPDLIAAHALSGCDMVACYHGIGKGTILKTLRSVYHFHSVGDTNAELPVAIQEATTFVSACYGYPESRNMSGTGHKVWKNRVGKSSKSVSNLSTLPPTTESFTENVKRAHLQACTWMYALNGDPPVLLPESYGWLRNEATQTLSPVTVPPGVEHAPEDILKLIKCLCESDSPCSSLRCGCNKARLGCTMFCVCQGEIACMNEQT